MLFPVLAMTIAKTCQKLVLVLMREEGCLYPGYTLLISDCYIPLVLALLIPRRYPLILDAVGPLCMIWNTGFFTFYIVGQDRDEMDGSQVA